MGKTMQHLARRIERRFFNCCQKVTEVPERLEVLFGWREASKCKKQITQVEKRLGPLKNKRSAIVRQLREDIAQLLRDGRHESAFYRAEQIIKDEGKVAVYEHLDLFCESIKNNLPYIRQNKDCPNDINEAVSSLIIASSRCRDLPELRFIRKLFGEYYGQYFVTVALELYSGNLVNRKIIESLSLKLVPNGAKSQLLDTIAKTCGLPMELQLSAHSEILTLTNLQENKSEKYEESRLQDSNVEEERGLTEEFSSESSFDDHKAEEIIYLDDNEEYQSPMSKDGTSQDQRVFMFKSSIVSTKLNLEIEYEGEDENAGSRRSISICSLDNRFDDVLCSTYYSKSTKQNRKSYSRKFFSNFKNHSESPRLQTKRRNSISGHTRNGMYNCRRGGRIPQATKWVLVPQRLSDEMIVLDDAPTNLASQLDEKADRVSFPIKKENQRFSRAMTLPTLERPKESQNENFLRRNSFALDNNFSHVHPKLPDYDEIAKEFRALKEAALKKK